MSQQERYDQQRRQAYHQSNLSGQGQQPGEGPQILQALSNIDDIPIDDDEEDVIGQMFSKVASTANYTEEELRSMEWLHEMIIPLWLSQFPDENGCHTSWQGWAHGDESAAKEPMSAEKRMKIETANITSKKVNTRSREGMVIKESSRDVSESIVNEPEADSGGGGILGRLKG